MSLQSANPLRGLVVNPERGEPPYANGLQYPGLVYSEINTFLAAEASRELLEVESRNDPIIESLLVVARHGATPLPESRLPRSGISLEHEGPLPHPEQEKPQ